MSDQNIPELPEYHCLRCGHTWTPRVKNPVECPRCKSTLWNKEYKGINRE